MFFIGATGGALLAAFFTDAFGPRAAVLAARRAVDDHRRVPDHARRVRHHATTCRSSSPSCARSWTSTGASRRSPRTIPALQVSDDRLLLRPGAGAVRRRLRGAAGRGARAARHQRRGQVDDPAGHRRPRARRRAASCASTAARSPTSRPSSGSKYGIRLLPGGKGVFPHMTVRENLEMARVHLPRRRRRTATGASTGCSSCSPTLADRQDADRRSRCRAASSRCWRWR